MHADQVAALRKQLGDTAVQTLHSMQSTEEQQVVLEQLEHAAKCTDPALKLIYITPGELFITISRFWLVCFAHIVQRVWHRNH